MGRPLCNVKGAAEMMGRYVTTGARRLLRNGTAIVLGDEISSPTIRGLACRRCPASRHGPLACEGADMKGRKIAAHPVGCIQTPLELIVL
jgi:hypothetical protein